MLEWLTKSEEYEPSEIDALDAIIKKCYKVLIKIAGIKACMYQLFSFTWERTRCVVDETIWEFMEMA